MLFYHHHTYKYTRLPFSQNLNSNIHLENNQIEIGHVNGNNKIREVDTSVRVEEQQRRSKMSSVFVASQTFIVSVVVVVYSQRRNLKLGQINALISF